MNGFKIFIIFVITSGSFRNIIRSRLVNHNRELKISDDEKIILFSGFSIAVIAIFLFLSKRHYFKEERRQI